MVHISYWCMALCFSVKNKAGKDVLVNQVGCYGINLGRIDFYFDKDKAHTNQGTTIVV